MSDVDALVAEAAADAPPRASLAQHENISRILWAMVNVSGTLNWGRGWPDAVASEFERAGLRRPSLKVIRWQKCRLASQPEEYAKHCPDPELLQDLLRIRA